MRISASALLRACLLASVPIAAYAQTEPVDRRSRVRNARRQPSYRRHSMALTTSRPRVNDTTAPTAGRIAHVHGDVSGRGQLRAVRAISRRTRRRQRRQLVFRPGLRRERCRRMAAQWALQNETNTGFTAPNATVLQRRQRAGSNVFKWVKITGSQGPAAWVVPAGALTQTFQWGSREDGMFMDKLAFGRAGVCYTVANLDAGAERHGHLPAAAAAGSAAVHAHRSADRDRQGQVSRQRLEPGHRVAELRQLLEPGDAGERRQVGLGRRHARRHELGAGRRGLRARQGQRLQVQVAHARLGQPAARAGSERSRRRSSSRRSRSGTRRSPRAIPDIDQIEVVNEPLHDPPRDAANGNYIERSAAQRRTTGWDWVIKSFELARAVLPERRAADLTTTASPTTAMRRRATCTIINLLKERGLIDAIGDQAHAFSTTEAAPMPNHQHNLDRLAATGLPIYITELDIDGVLAGVLNHEVQLANYPAHVPGVLGAPGRQGRDDLGLRARLPLAQRAG